MRGTRRLILLCILGLIVFVGVTYRVQKALQTRLAPELPATLPERLAAKAQDWVWSQSEGGKPAVEVRAKAFEQLSGENRFLLTGVNLRLFQKDGKSFDQVTSASAEFDTNQAVLFSQGNVEITMGLPMDAEAGNAIPLSGRLMKIRSSGVRLESKTGRVSTESPASFEFDRGKGSATGAVYEPALRELRMHKDVHLFWTDTGQEMSVDSGSLVYREQEAKVYLSPWSRFRRGRLVLEAGASEVKLEEGVIRQVDAQEARGTEQEEDRSLLYAAKQLRLHMNERGLTEAIEGRNGSRLESQTTSGTTLVEAQDVDLWFDASGEDSQLQRAKARGNGTVTSRPLASQKKSTPDRILRSETIDLEMKAGGAEIAKVETQGPGTVVFVPNSPEQRHRTLAGERLWMEYGVQNRLESFRALGVNTRTQPKEGGAQAAVAITSSRNLLARFSPETGEMTSLEQWDNFEYQEGERKAKSQRASLASREEKITLEVQARLSDRSGATSADRIVIDQKTSDMTAWGHVASTRLPGGEQGAKKAAPGLLSEDQPLQATADYMASSEANRQVRYKGSALLWQGPNRLEADAVHIDREREVLRAKGRVHSQFVDRPKEGGVPAKPGTAAATAILTSVKSDELVYSDRQRVGNYTGAATLERPGLSVAAREIQAFLAPAEAEASLDKAIGKGSVRIRQQAPGRTRDGSAEHAEYFTAEEKVILTEGKPELVDSLRGVTRGQRLTYWAKDDRLMVEGSEEQRSTSRIRRKTREK